jgi:hypothetical protein
MLLPGCLLAILYKAGCNMRESFVSTIDIRGQTLLKKDRSVKIFKYLEYDELVKNRLTGETRSPEPIDITGFRLEFIPVKIGTGMTKRGLNGLFTRPSNMFATVFG